MSGKIKNIVSLLILLPIASIFFPLIVIGDIKLSTFDIMSMGMAEYGSSSLEAAIVSEMGSSVTGLIAIVFFVFAFLLFHAGVVLVLPVRNAYGYAIVSTVVYNICLGIAYFNISDEIENIKYILSIFENYINISKMPAIVWCFLNIIVIAISVLGIVKMPALKPGVGTYGSRVGTGTEVINRYPSFYGAMIGRSRMFAGKAFIFNEMMPVYVVEKNNIIFLLRYEDIRGFINNHMIDELLAEIYYLPQYEEYVVRPADKLRIFLESGQPLGKERKYYLPRGTEIYCKERNQRFILA